MHICRACRRLLIAESRNLHQQRRFASSTSQKISNAGTDDFTESFNSLSEYTSTDSRRKDAGQQDTARSSKKEVGKAEAQSSKGRRRNVPLKTPISQGNIDLPAGKGLEELKETVSQRANGSGGSFAVEPAAGSRGRTRPSKSQTRGSQATLERASPNPLIRKLRSTSKLPSDPRHSKCTTQPPPSTESSSRTPDPVRQAMYAKFDQVVESLLQEHEPATDTSESPAQSKRENAAKNESGSAEPFTTIKEKLARNLKGRVRRDDQVSKQQTDSVTLSGHGLSLAQEIQQSEEDAARSVSDMLFKTSKEPESRGEILQLIRKVNASANYPDGLSPIDTAMHGDSLRVRMMEDEVPGSTDSVKPLSTGKGKDNDLIVRFHPRSKAAESLESLHSDGWGLDAPAGNVEEMLLSPKKKTPKGEQPATPKTPAKRKEGESMTQRRERLKQEAAKGRSTTTSKSISAKMAGGSSPKSSKRKNSNPLQATESSFSTADAATTSDAPAVNITVDPKKLAVTPLDVPQPLVPGLEYGLDRVLFNPGVYQLQDPLSRVYNFDPYLQRIMPVVEFDYNALKEYKTSSQDVALAKIAKEHGKRYIGSTSSMTGTLGHFHYLLSAFRPLNLSMLSRGFPEQSDEFTLINRAPNAIFLRYKDGTYAIDADKEYDGANVLMMLGKSMEKLLTLPKSDFERYRKSDPRSVPEEERSAPESFCYTTMGDFLMRSQLDAYDSRLPGTGMFDLKTRAVLSVRMDTADFEPMTGYEIQTLQGRFESYEREYYDMMRSTMLKYMLQVRMGRMDGIFIAYHNVERIFGFQYVSLQEMDRALHGQTDPYLGDQEFKISLEMLNKVFNLATAKFPQQSLRFHFETAQVAVGGSEATTMWVFGEPMTEDQIEAIQAKPKAKIQAFERTMMGMEEKDDPEVEVSDADEASRTAAPTESKASAARTEGTSSKAPLFAANILCEFDVNHARQVRPSHLTSRDHFEVLYSIQEWDPDKKDFIWPMYEDMKARRKEAFARVRPLGEDESEGDDGKASEPISKTKQKEAKRSASYIEMLRRLSQNGRVFREKVEKMEEGKEPVVVGWENGTPSTEEQPGGGDMTMEGVQGVEDYMAWLYRQ